jgi:lipoate-protein ligase A
MEEFSDYIFTAILNSNTGNTQEELDEKSVEEIEKLRTERFSTWDWNYGYSPKYQVKNTVDYFGSPVQFTTLVVKGMIARLEIEGDPGMDAHRLDHLLIGRKHDKPRIHKILKEDGIDFNILIRILQGIF